MRRRKSLCFFVGMTTGLYLMRTYCANGNFLRYAYFLKGILYMVALSVAVYWIYRLYENKGRTILVFILSIMCGILLGIEEGEIENISVNKERICIEGSISLRNDRYDKVEFVVREKYRNLNIFISCDKEKISETNVCAGSLVSIKLQKVEKIRADDKIYRFARSRGVYHRGELIDVNAKQEKSFAGELIKFANKLREKFYKRLEYQLTHREKAILKAILFSDKNTLSKEDYDMIQKNGGGHILATSGLHLGVIFCVLEFVFKKVKCKIIFELCAIWLYVLMVGFNASIIRGAIMISIFTICRRFYIHCDLISLCSIAAILQIFSNPMIIFDTGFQLSYLAMFIIGYMLCIRNISKEIDKNSIYRTVEPIIFTCILQMLMLPMTAGCFGYISLKSFAANIFISTVGVAILIIGFTALITSLVGMEMLYHISIDLIRFLIDTFIFINKIFFGKGNLIWKIHIDGLYIFTFYICLFILLSEEFRSRIDRRKLFSRGNV